MSLLQNELVGQSMQENINGLENEIEVTKKLILNYSKQHTETMNNLFDSVDVMQVRLEKLRVAMKELN